MFGLVDRSAARGGAQIAPRPAASPSPRPRGPDAPDAEGLRSPSPWFGRREATPDELSFRTGSAWTTGATTAGPLVVVAKVGAPTRSAWRHPAIQLR